MRARELRSLLQLRSPVSWWNQSRHSEERLRGDDCFARRARFDEIVQDAVRDCFVERVLVSIRRQIKLKRLAFDAETIGYVIDIDLGEIRLPSNGTNGSEIICLKMNAVIAVGRWILEGLKPRFCGRSRKFRVAVPEQC